MTLTCSDWSDVFPAALHLAKSGMARCYKLASLLQNSEIARLDLMDGRVAAPQRLQPLLQKDADFTTVESLDGPSTIRVKAADTPVTRVAGPIAQLTNIAPSWWNKPIGGPTPLAATLAGGMLGAGGGYLAGRLGEAFLPQSVLDRGKLRRMGAIFGGMVGSSPGLFLGAEGMKMRPADGKSDWRAWIEPNPLVNTEMPAKAADWGNQTGASLGEVPVDAFNRAVLSDPFLTPQLQAATVGLVSSADTMRGNSGIIGPQDLVRVAVGMGAGLSQAYLGGKVLGALAGLTPDAQQKLQQMGMFAGALKAVVPGMFGSQ